MRAIPVYLLAGGKSSRFGSDKARAEIDGVPLILRLARRVEPIARTLTVVADRSDKYLDLGLPTLPDLVPDQGPLGGIYTALAHYRGPGWVLVLSCDLMELRTEWVEELVSRTDDRVQAVAYRDRFWQAFPGLYHSSLLPLIEQRLGAGDLALHRLLAQAASVGVPLPAAWPAIVQANTRRELDAFVAPTPLKRS